MLYELASNFSAAGAIAGGIAGGILAFKRYAVTAMLRPGVKLRALITAGAVGGALTGGLLFAVPAAIKGHFNETAAPAQKSITLQDCLKPDQTARSTSIERTTQADGSTACKFTT